MAPIRKGDGTPLEIPGVSEVRSGDGRVFFDGDAIPDEAAHVWDYDDPIDQRTIEDSVGDADVTLEFDKQNEEFVSFGGGSEDYGLISQERIDGFINEILTDHAVLIELSYDPSNIEGLDTISAVWWSGEDDRFTLIFPGGGDEIRYRFAANGDFAGGQSDGLQNIISANEKFTLLVNKESNDPSNWSMYVNDIDNELFDATHDDSPSSLQADLDEDLAVGAGNITGSIQRNAEIDIHRMRFYNESLSEDRIEEELNAS